MTVRRKLVLLGYRWWDDTAEAGVLSLDRPPVRDNSDAVHAPEKPTGPTTAQAARAAAVGHLTAVQRARARHRVVQAALLGRRHHGHMTYTQGPQRWDGIAHHRIAGKGQFPRYADCSAFATWCYWTATLQWHPVDIVNGEHWRAGYTGTMTHHGHQVPLGHLRGGDLVFYGGSHSIPEHVAVYVGARRVVSFGGPGGPLLLPVGYRTDVNHCRRYLG